LLLIRNAELRALFDDHSLKLSPAMERALLSWKSKA
jgi:hypothetical protein